MLGVCRAISAKWQLESTNIFFIFRIFIEYIALESDLRLLHFFCDSPYFLNKKKIYQKKHENGCLSVAHPSKHVSSMRPCTCILHRKNLHLVQLFSVSLYPVLHKQSNFPSPRTHLPLLHC